MTLEEIEARLTKIASMLMEAESQEEREWAALAVDMLTYDVRQQIAFLTPDVPF